MMNGPMRNKGRSPAHTIWDGSEPRAHNRWVLGHFRWSRSVHRPRRHHRLPRSSTPSRWRRTPPPSPASTNRRGFPYAFCDETGTSGGFRSDRDFSSSAITRRSCSTYQAVTVSESLFRSVYWWWLLRNLLSVGAWFPAFKSAVLASVQAWRKSDDPINIVRAPSERQRGPIFWFICQIRISDAHSIHKRVPGASLVSWGPHHQAL